MLTREQVIAFVEEARDRAGGTNRKLGKAIGRAHTTVQGWCDRGNMTTLDITLVCQTLNMDPPWVVGGQRLAEASSNYDGSGVVDACKDRMDAILPLFLELYTILHPAAEEVADLHRRVSRRR